MKNPFRKWFKVDPKKKRYNSNKGLWKYKYLDFLDNKDLNDYVDKTAREVAEKENIPIRMLPSDVLNFGIPKENRMAGQFIHYINFKEDPPFIPRIEVAYGKEEHWTLIHELGHFFRYKRRKTQTEDAADAYILEFFYKHLPPFFRWVFQLHLSIRVKDKKIREFTDEESFEHFLACEEFLETIKIDKDEQLEYYA